MTSFSYHAPLTLETTFDLLERYGADARIMAGGTDLLVRIKTGRIAPRAVIDIKHIADLNASVVLAKDRVEIGSLALMADLQNDPILKRHFLALLEAAASVGSVQIRNRATLAGNLCNASPAADTAPALLIYNALVNLASRKGLRALPLRQFILGPGKTALEAGELVSSITIPLPAADQAAVFSRLTRRKGVDLATINLCCQVFKSGLVRFAIGAAAPVPFLVEETSGRLVDPSLDPEIKDQLLRGLMESAAPISDVRASRDYRQAMLVVLARRALAESLKRLNS